MPYTASRFAALAFWRHCVVLVESHRRRAVGGVLRGPCPLGKPLTKIVGKIGPQGNRRAVAVLFVRGVEHQAGQWTVEDQLADSD
ncbi:MAG TPA: hypothetical protein VGJ26_21805 [Pirellulales bacterium]